MTVIYISRVANLMWNWTVTTKKKKSKDWKKWYLQDISFMCGLTIINSQCNVTCSIVISVFVTVSLILFVLVLGQAPFYGSLL